MLKSLHIKNYAIIEELTMDFGPKLNIITGETGAGKSILTGALGLIQGNRADTKVLYDTEQKCIVEAIFESDSVEVKTIFEEHNIEFESPIIVRRMIAPSGKSRAFVNDEPVNLSFIKALSNVLIDMHRQFDTIGINDETTQFNLLDSVAKTQEDVVDYQDFFQSYKKQKTELNRLIEQEIQVMKELDFLEFQFSELDEAAFLDDEQSSLENEVNVLENADSIISVMNRINYELEEGESNVVGQLSDMRNELERLGDVGEDIESLLSRLISTEEELRDIAQQASNHSEMIEADPATLGEKQERLSMLYRLLQKHNKEDLRELLVFQEELHTKIKAYRAHGTDRKQLEAAVESAEKQLTIKGKKLHDKRKSVIKTLEKDIQSKLANLGMEHAQFVVSLTSTKNIRHNGTDELNFLFSANPGRSPQALNEVASGGELSRLALSLKSLVAGNVEMGTLIFDEIDTGISGDVSGKMGVILKQLADKHQLISITHSPQIAAKADTHFFIYKLVENQRTYTKVRLLDREGRVNEIATMLSGNPPTDSAKKNAEELID